MKKKALVITGILIVAIIGFTLSRGGKAVEVNTTEVIIGTITEYVEELGEVKVENQVNIHSSVTGTINDILIGIGDQVNKGEVLLKIDNNSLLTQIEILKENKRALTSQYEETLKINNKEIEKLKLQLPIMENKVEEAERTATNSKELYEAGAISYNEYELTKRALEIEQSNLTSLKLDLELLSSDTTKQLQSQINQINLELQELINKSSDFIITAPIEGTILSKSIEKGSFLQPGLNLMTIGDKSEIYLESDILVGEIANVSEGSIIEITNRDLKIEGATGSIRRIHPQAISKTSDLGIQQKRIKIEAEIDETLENLRPGYNVDIKIITNKRDNTLIIPSNSIFSLNGKEFVFMNENNTAVIREITTGIESQRQIEVLSGLQEGDQVIMSPGDNLEDGININPQKL